MSLVTQAIAHNALSSFLPDVRKIIAESWLDYMNLYPPELRVIHSARTRANILHDHQISKASTFAIENGFRLENFHEMKVLLIGNYAIRFKKFDEELNSSNQPTKQVKKFRLQESLLIPGITETYNLEAGYVLNEDKTEIAKTWLVQPAGNGINWRLELSETGVQSDIADLLAAVEQDEMEEGATIRGKEDKVVPLGKKAK